jgi:hypothetical protein
MIEIQKVSGYPMVSYSNHNEIVRVMETRIAEQQEIIEHLRTRLKQETGDPRYPADPDWEPVGTSLHFRRRGERIEIQITGVNRGQPRRMTIDLEVAIMARKMAEKGIITIDDILNARSKPWVNTSVTKSAE